MCKHQMSGWCFYSAKFLMLTSLAILQDTKSRKFITIYLSLNCGQLTTQWLNSTKLNCEIFHLIYLHKMSKIVAPSSGWLLQAS